MISIQKLAITTFIISSLVNFSCNGMYGADTQTSLGVSSISDETHKFEILRGKLTAFVVSLDTDVTQRAKPLLRAICSKLYSKAYAQKIIKFANSLKKDKLITPEEYATFIAMINENDNYDAEGYDSNND